MRTETVISDTYDFAIDRRLNNLDAALMEVGFTANRRLLGVQRNSHDCHLGEETFGALHRPAVAEERPAHWVNFTEQLNRNLLSGRYEHTKSDSPHPVLG